MPIFSLFLSSNLAYSSIAHGEQWKVIANGADNPILDKRRHRDHFSKMRNKYCVQVKLFSKTPQNKCYHKKLRAILCKIGNKVTARYFFPISNLLFLIFFWSMERAALNRIMRAHIVILYTNCMHDLNVYIAAIIIYGFIVFFLLCITAVCITKSAAAAAAHGRAKLNRLAK